MTRVPIPPLDPTGAAVARYIAGKRDMEASLTKLTNWANVLFQYHGPINVGTSDSPKMVCATCEDNSHWPCGIYLDMEVKYYDYVHETATFSPGDNPFKHFASD